VNIVVNGRFSAFKTGVGRVLENYLVHLARIDTRNDYYIYVNPEFVDLFDLGNPRFRVISNGVPAGASLKNHLWTQTGFVKAVRRHAADLVILPQINLYVRKLAPTLLFQHDLIEYHVANQVITKMLFRKFAIPHAIKLADRILCVSQNTVEDMKRFLGVPAEKMVMVHSGINHEQIYPRDAAEAEKVARERYGMGKAFLLYVGTLTLPQKNLVRLVEAFDAVRKRGHDVELLLAGAFGKDHERILQRIEELGLREHVRTPGYVADEDLPYLYSAARAFCFPSLYEGFGLPVLEAMACGCPSVTSNVSSLPEVAGDGAKLVDPHDVEGIAGALSEMLTDEAQREAYSRRGIAQAQKFCWPDAAAKLLEVIESFGPEGRGSRS
jgi:glycosyltransferase involved in cell wall biosynthesis